jgi:altronate dehydratase large subunit
VTTPYGRGQLGPDKLVHTAQLVGLGAHPNVGATLLVAADRPTAEAVAQAIAVRSGKPVEIVSLDDVEEDALALTALGIRAGGALRAAFLRIVGFR